MAVTLYDATIPTFLQTLGALRGVLEKGQAHANTNGIDVDTLVEARLIEGMFPLGLQIQRVSDHSRGALTDVSMGAFTMPRMDVSDYAGLQRIVADSEAALRAWTREGVNALEGREVVFDTGTSRSVFTAEAFLFSFSLPNFHFHAVTAYDILRARGAPLGKRDYLGSMRLALE
jgi:uncharacterized protein